MQSLLDRYISTLALESVTTPAILSIHDALIVVERWSHKALPSLDSLHKEYISGVFLYETPEDKVEFPIIEIRKFISDTAKIPYEGKHIYILSGIDTGSLEAMNALLKVLEDTPRHAIILLVVSDREALLETIHSRTIDLFRSERRLIDGTHADAIRTFFEWKKEQWISTLFGLKPTREEAIDILTLALEYSTGESIDAIETGFIQLFTTNEPPRNILDLAFLW
jgi:DNA polymerase III, delta subunit